VCRRCSWLTQARSLIPESTLERLLSKSDPGIEDAYRVLELPVGAGMHAVREAYRDLSRVWHPDRFAGNAALQARATQRQQELNVAYRVLHDAHLAGALDAALPATPAESSVRSAEQAAEARADVAPEQADHAPPGSSVAHPDPLTPLARRLAAALGAALLFVLLTIAVALGDGTVFIDGEPLRVSSLASGDAQSCGAVGSNVVCWDATRIRGASAARAGAGPYDLRRDVLALGVGLAHACALLDDGSAHCWGANFAGQLGALGLNDSRSPVRVASPEPLSAVSTLGRHTCATSRAGEVYCWGDDTDGQLGIGAPAARCRAGSFSFFCSDRPERVGSSSWTTVTAGGGHSCGIDSGGALQCWGSNRYRQLGVSADESCEGVGGQAPCSRSPVLVTMHEHVARSVAAGASHTCALTLSGQVLCWGSNRYYQAGPDRDDVVAEPSLLPGRLRFHTLIAGGYHTCGLTAESVLYCWGSDAGGELRGRGRNRCGGSSCARRPIRIATGVVAASAGFGVTCVTTTRGHVRCWGDGGESTPGARVQARPPKFSLPDPRTALTRLRLRIEDAAQPLRDVLSD
jgi:alpha-tubulin suppressor-like RCC1 family protein